MKFEVLSDEDQVFKIMNTHKQKGSLSIVSIPIGNPDDITIRAIKVLKDSDMIICEELRNGQKLLKSLSIEKPLVTLNEHNEETAAESILLEILGGKHVALVSDCGTPVFSDPGTHLLRIVTEMGQKVIPVPGPSSLMAAISVCNFGLDHFVFAGFLSPKSDERIHALNNYRKLNQPIILMDTPYRLTRLLEEVMEAFGKNQKVCLACNLTLPTELILHGTAQEVYKRVKGQKKEFILILARPAKRN